MIKHNNIEKLSFFLVMSEASALKLNLKLYYKILGKTNQISNLNNFPFLEWVEYFSFQM